MEKIPNQKSEAFESERSPQVEVEPLDAELFERFKELYFEDYEYLSGDATHRKEQKEAFVNGEIENPALDYPKLEDFDFEGREQALLELKADALAHENEVVAEAYRWRINEMIAQVRMLKAAHEGQDHRFARYSEFVYGKPSEEAFEYDKAQFQRIRGKALASEDEERIAAVTQIDELLGNMEPRNNTSSVAEAFPEKPEDDRVQLNTGQLKDLFTAALVEHDLDDWEVVVDEEGARASISVSQETKTVHIPNDEQVGLRRKPLSLVKAKAMIAHEIEVHAKRRKKRRTK